jgi:starch phosphorylase
MNSLEKRKLKDDFKANFINKIEEVSGECLDDASLLKQYQALSEVIMDKVTTKWAKSNSTYNTYQSKQVYFFSIEFLIGKLLKADLCNLGIEDLVTESLEELGLDYKKIQAMESDPGLGNGGLGRLMACYLDSSAALEMPAHGNGIRYKHGLFEQRIINGEQIEVADNWLKDGYPFEIRKPDHSVIVKFYGDVHSEKINGNLTFIHENYEPILAIPYDIPIKGYLNDTVNSLRLWSAEPLESFDLPVFNQGQFLDAVLHKSEAESISQILYPNDNGFDGKLLRLKQEYFFVCAGLKRIVRNYKKNNHDSIDGFSKKICIHINDTHPALCAPELMRILMDEESLGWDEAFRITVETISFTNHTILPEALEKWSIDIIKPLLPRIYMIIEEINRRFLIDINEKYPYDISRNNQLSIIKDGVVNMASLAIVGSHSINGVAALHSKILREETFHGYYQIFPERFHSITNGVTHRRFLMNSNPDLKHLIDQTIGDEWHHNLFRLEDLIQYRDDPSFQTQFNVVKLKNKERLTQYINDENNLLIDPHSIFDIQVKRIHEYKRQLLNALHILYLYNQLKANPNISFTPRTFIFAGKAAPGYYYAKQVIHLINAIATLVNTDKSLHGQLKVVFLANFNVSLGELIYPAANISEQISTAGKEASGTGNMKFMMNGAITLGTMDGANIEIFEAVGPNNIVTFGLSAEEVSRYQQFGGYCSTDIYEKDPCIQLVLHQLIDDTLGTGINFQTIYDSLLLHNDTYFLLKDFNAYAHAQNRLSQLYSDSKKWTKMSISNTAYSGMFSSDRSIKDYQREIWKIVKR